MKYVETLEPGFYLMDNKRCYYITGTTSGNKWIDLEVPEPLWYSLLWNCVDRYDIELSVYSSDNPTKFLYLNNNLN